MSRHAPPSGPTTTQRPSEGVQERDREEGQNPGSDKKKRIKRGEKLDKDSAPQWASLQFVVTRLKLIYHEGWRCDENPLIYCKGPWLPLSLFTIWYQVVASTTSLHDLQGKDSSQLAAEKKKQCLDTEKKSHVFLLAHRGNSSSSSLTGMAGNSLNTHPQLLERVPQKKGACELHCARIFAWNKTQWSDCEGPGCSHAHWKHLLSFHAT